MPEAETRDDALTISALGVLAFIVADLAHEVIGHGAAYLALGGRSFTMTTTRWIGRGAHVDAAGHLFVGVEHGDLYGRIFSLGGPLGGLLVAAIAGLALRFFPNLGVRSRLLLWLTLAFNLFWTVGYLIYSGVTDIGDFAEGVRGVPPALWRLCMVVAGVLLDLAVARALARAAPIGGDRGRLRRAVWLSYLAAGIVACAAALLDPRGADQLYISGAPSSFLANALLLTVPGLLGRFPSNAAAAAEPIARSLGWILAALLAAALFVGVLGPGISLSL
jgi:hypothetical protein